MQVLVDQVLGLNYNSGSHVVVREGFTEVALDGPHFGYALVGGGASGIGAGARPSASVENLGHLTIPLLQYSVHTIAEFLELVRSRVQLRLIDIGPPRGLRHLFRVLAA